MKEKRKGIPQNLVKNPLFLFLLFGFAGFSFLFLVICGLALGLGVGAILAHAISKFTGIDKTIIALFEIGFIIFGLIGMYLYENREHL